MDEVVGSGLPNVGREAVGGSIMEGRKTEVAGSSVTRNMRLPMSSRAGSASGMNVIATVEISGSRRPRTATMPTDELKTFEMMMPLFDTVMLAVAFDREEVERYKLEARNRKNI